MKVVPKDRKVEAVAAALAAYAGDAFACTGSVTGLPTCTAKWPKDFGRTEQAGFRIAARGVLDALEELEAPHESLRAAAAAARETLLFRHESGGYTPDDIRYVIHAIDKALGNELTPFRRIGDNEAPEGEEK